MIAISPLYAAISAHRAAYDAFQVAPEGEDSELANCEMLDALDALVIAACAFPLFSRPLPVGTGALLAHLQWWLADEAVNAADYQPNFAILLDRAADLAAVLAEPANPDPIIAAIAAADMANATHTACLVHLDEDDEAQIEQCNAAAQETDRTFNVVQEMMPVTLGGLHALTQFYARDAKLYDRCSGGSEYLAHVARALIACDSTGQFSLIRQSKDLSDQRLVVVIPPLEKTTCPGVPDQAQVEAAWCALSAETRDRIGIIATDMVFQSFVSGDACAPKDRAVPGWSKKARAIRDAAMDASCQRLTEVHNVVEAVLPDLFGPVGQNPDWAVAMGARR
ncbi:hypothetical protein [Methylobacterium sp. E-046]|uniref:hypothetical protein n=1 Tax=Methylobacterium sp. E-046 TaxID=2836576 RepID=UPI001FBA355D|nr:hypothetical protein [Methylobacterium sp. E-046]MCJ2098975.1 hypothetical protein [Methylobacterium sp. E-046]